MKFSRKEWIFTWRELKLRGRECIFTWSEYTTIYIYVCICMYTYTYIYIYIYIYPLIYTPLPYSMWLRSKVHARGTTWCIHVAEGTKLDQNGLKMGSIHLFVHPQWSNITFGKTCFGPIFHPFLLPKRPLFKEYWDFHGPKPVQMGSK